MPDYPTIQAGEHRFERIGDSIVITDRNNQSMTIPSGSFESVVSGWSSLNPNPTATDASASGPTKTDGSRPLQNPTANSPAGTTAPDQAQPTAGATGPTDSRAKAQQAASRAQASQQNNATDTARTSTGGRTRANQ